MMFALFVYVVLPIAAVGLRLGLRSQNAELMEDGRFKILAAYCPTPVAMIVSVVVLTGAASRVAQPGIAGVLAIAGSVLLGTVAGFSVSFFLMWLLFHLRFAEAIVGWIFTSIFYFLGVVAAVVVLMVVMTPIALVMGYSSGGRSIAHGWMPRPPT